LQKSVVAGCRYTPCLVFCQQTHCRFFLTSNGSIYRDWGLFDYVVHGDKQVQPYAECTAAAIAAAAAAPAAAAPATPAASVAAATAAGSTGAAQCPVTVLNVSATRGHDPMPLKVFANYLNVKTIALTAHENTTVKELKLRISERMGEHILS
jgi:hypothetical protein